MKTKNCPVFRRFYAVCFSRFSLAMEGLFARISPNKRRQNERPESNQHDLSSTLVSIPD
jgi:hypothetical protein